MQLRHNLFQSSDLGSTFNFSINYNQLCQKDGKTHSILSARTNLWLQRIKHGNKQHYCLIFTWRALGSPVKSPSLQTKHHYQNKS